MVNVNKYLKLNTKNTFHRFLFNHKFSVNIFTVFMLSIKTYFNGFSPTNILFGLTLYFLEFKQQQL